MSTPDSLVAAVIAAAQGRVVGRIRLQKLFYLLEQKGMNSGLPFSYHYYGPYSRALDGAIDRAQAMQGVREEIEYRQVDGMPYSIFSLRNGTRDQVPQALGTLSFDDVRRLVATMATRSSTILELAATIHWLINMEHASDWRSELVRRKGTKTEKGRTEEALKLLQQLGLSVHSATA